MDTESRFRVVLLRYCLMSDAYYASHNNTVERAVKRQRHQSLGLVHTGSGLDHKITRLAEILLWRYATQAE